MFFSRFKPKYTVVCCTPPDLIVRIFSRKLLEIQSSTKIFWKAEWLTYKKNSWVLYRKWFGCTKMYRIKETQKFSPDRGSNPIKYFFLPGSFFMATKWKFRLFPFICNLVFVIWTNSMLTRKKKTYSWEIRNAQSYSDFLAYASCRPITTTYNCLMLIILCIFWVEILSAFQWKKKKT